MASHHLSRGTLSFVLEYFRRRRAQFGLLALLVLGAAGCAVAVQYGMKLLVDAMAAGPEGRGRVWETLAFFIGLIIIENGLWRLAGWTGCRAVVGSGVDIRVDLFDYLSRHPMRYFQEHLSGALGHRITATAGAFGALTSTLVWNVAPPCVDFIGALIIFTEVDGRMAVALALFVVFMAAGLFWFGARGRPLHDSYAVENNAVSGQLVDVVANIWSVKAFSARRAELGRLRARFSREAEAQKNSWMWLEKTRVLHDVSLSVMASAMLGWAVHLFLRAQISAGDVVVVSALTFRILHGSRDLVLALVGTTQQWHYMGETLKTIGRPHGLTDAPHARALVPLGGAIAFEGVTFGYDDERTVLANFDLCIPAGQHVGVVGTSGAGKTTLLGLLQRLYDVRGGRILLDGQPIHELEQDSLRAKIAVVPQEISLFQRSILENIRYGRPGATDEEVRAAARASACEGFVARLPQGYDTLVGERGVKLSGGQRQRVGIARALLKNAPVILLDEATSALDTESEREIQRAVDVLIRGRTLVAVAHRLSTLVRLDRIVVLHEGRIVEDGSPKDLIRRGGVFARLWRLQAEGLSLEEALERTFDETEPAGRRVGG